MKYVYIEAENNKQPEYHFLATYAAYIGLKDVQFVPIAGKDKLGMLKVSMMDKVLAQDTVAILFDADYPNIGGGFEKRKEDILQQLRAYNIPAKVFLWPNNQSDGDFERMLEEIVRKDMHQLFFDCFRDYELCVAKEYTTPNRKGKFHTFVHAQRGLSNTQKRKVGSGNWLFDNSALWNLDSPYLNALSSFLLSL